MPNGMMAHASKAAPSDFSGQPSSACQGERKRLNVVENLTEYTGDFQLTQEGKWGAKLVNILILVHYKCFANNVARHS
jgi:hypothetical protein